MLTPLTSFQEAFALSIFPTGSAVVSARPMQEMVPCPIHLAIVGPDGVRQEAVLRLARNRGGVEREASVLPALAQLGLPVPAVLAGPVCDPDDAQTGAITLNSLLPGRTLQDWSRIDSDGLELALDQTVEAVLRLHSLTASLLQTDQAQILPHKTLSSELLGLARSGNPWVQTPTFADATARLAPVVEAIETPLVFSNGDYQPGNFLSDGRRLTGFLDFEKACFEDPLLTLARYPVYNLDPMNRAGVVDRFLGASGFSRAEFAPRLGLFCLRTLLTKTPVSGGTPAQQERREYVLALLQSALAASSRR
jgi:aminoglycoside phosphotransferase (APT) family kinase protein